VAVVGFLTVGVKVVVDPLVLLETVEVVGFAAGPAA
jgi:hypothetical protein